MIGISISKTPEVDISVLIELPQMASAASSAIVDGCDLVCWWCWLIGCLIGSCLMNEKIPLQGFLSVL
jgi:hypothetical protein